MVVILSTGAVNFPISTLWLKQNTILEFEANYSTNFSPISPLVLHALSENVIKSYHRDSRFILIPSTALAAKFNLVPISLPFLAPFEWLGTGGTNFFW